VLPALLDLYQPPPLVNADAGFTERLETHRQRLMQFYRASLHAYDGDRDAWGRDMREVMRGDGGNPYPAGLPGSNAIVGCAGCDL
jgi:hypothetical protein